MEIPFGEFVRRRRQHMGMKTQKDLAGRIGLSKEYVSEIERGVTSGSRMQAQTLYRLATALTVSLEDLYHWAEAGTAPIEAAGKGPVPTSWTRQAHLLVAMLQYRGLLSALVEQETVNEALVCALLEAQAALGAPLSKEACLKLISDYAKIHCT
jgi:transcriptional regulator with XRE-family HTH domain